MPILQRKNRLLRTTSPLIVNERDETLLVWIPPGEFVMGDGRDSNCPERRVYLAGYYLGVGCITNRQYQRFVQASGHRPPDHADYSTPIWQGGKYPEELAEHPVVGVSWDDAEAYCAWAGLALPTEAQWEKGARGPGGLIYPWGEAWAPERCRNYSGNRGNETTCPVFACPAGVSGYGPYNQSGNVWEWCRDWYNSGYYSQSPRENPMGPATGSDRVIRGGAAGASAIPAFSGVRTAASSSPRSVMSATGSGHVCPPGQR